GAVGADRAPLTSGSDLRAPWSLGLRVGDRGDLRARVPADRADPDRSAHGRGRPRSAGRTLWRNRGAGSTGGGVRSGRVLRLVERGASPSAGGWLGLRASTTAGRRGARGLIEEARKAAAMTLSMICIFFEHCARSYN